MSKGDRMIRLDHGSGGRATLGLIQGPILKHLGNPLLRELDDQAKLEVEGLGLAFTTDGFVVDPPFFPGGDIGSLSIHGTINDLAVGGASPIALSLALIIEEGLAMETLEQVLASAGEASREAGVPVVTGDTKVVQKGGADGIFITTTGLGILPRGLTLSPRTIMRGDHILVSAPVGDHGATIMACREGMGLAGEMKSDSAPLHGLVKEMLRSGSEGIRAMRDPTRGGLASTLNEIAMESSIQLELQEESIPVRPPVQGVCEILGLDPLYCACEGVLVAFVAPSHSQRILEAMRSHPMGREAVRIGEATEGPARVVLSTRSGGRRVLDLLTGAQLPRIC